MALSVSQKVILQRENTWGTTDGGTSPVAFALPIETESMHLVIEPFNDQTKRGNVGLDGNIYPTAKRAEGSIEGPFFVDECAYFLMALFGQTSVTSAASPSLHTHTFIGKTDFSTAANSLSISSIDDVEARQSKGCYVSDMTLRFSAAEGILTYTATMMGKDNVDADDASYVAITDPGFAEGNPPLGWTAALKQGNSSASSTADRESTLLGGSNYCQIVDAEITISRPTSLTYVFCEQQFANRADPGPMEITLSLTADYTADAAGKALTDDYRDDNRWELVFELDNNLSGVNDKRIRLFLPYVSMLDAPQEIDRSDTSMRIAMNMRALNNTHTDINGPARMRAMTQNSLTTAYGV